MADRVSVNTKTDALIVIHVQRDFCPGGALPVPEGDAVVPVLNRWLAVQGLLKVGTRDWHPPNHCSFKAQGGPWPPHCVQNTPGAEYHPDLSTEAFHTIISGATDPKREAYSGFDAPDLLKTLRRHKIRRLWIGGLATEYCVKETVIGARRNGFEVFVIEDAIRGIEVKPGDCDRARTEMLAAGARFVQTADILGK